MLHHKGCAFSDSGSFGALGVVWSLMGICVTPAQSRFFHIGPLLLALSLSLWLCLVSFTLCVSHWIIGLLCNSYLMNSPFLMAIVCKIWWDKLIVEAYLFLYLARPFIGETWHSPSGEPSILRKSLSSETFCLGEKSVTYASIHMALTEAACGICMSWWSHA